MQENLIRFAYLRIGIIYFKQKNNVILFELYTIKGSIYEKLYITPCLEKKPIGGEYSHGTSLLIYLCSIM